MKVKKLLSFLLAGLLFFGGFPLDGLLSFAVTDTVPTAPSKSDAPKVYFYDDDGKTVEMISVVEGTSRNILVPENLNSYMLGSPAFVFKDEKNNELSGDRQNKISYNLGDKSHNIKAFFETKKGIIPDGEDEATIKINPNYYATTLKGECLEKQGSNNYSSDVLLKSNAVVINENKVTLTALGEENSAGVMLKVTNNTGIFKDISANIIANGIMAERVENHKEVPLRVKFSDDLILYIFSKQFEEVVPDINKPDEKEKVMKVKADSVFDVTFSPIGQTSNMTMKIVSPKKAVNDLATVIKENPNTYIVLSSPDSKVDAVTKNFFAINKIKYLGAECLVSWEWKVTSSNQGADLAVKVDSTSVGEEKTMFSVKPAEDDTMGVLTGKIKCRPNAVSGIDPTAEGKVEINLVIRGKGTEPSLMLENNTVGNKIEGDKTTSLNPANTPLGWETDLVSYMPKELDVNVGDVASKLPVLPYKFDGRIFFGDKNAVADYVTIESGKKTGSIEIRVRNENTAYSLGSKIMNDIPGTGQLTNIEFIAKEPSASWETFIFKFYQKGNDGKDVNYKTIETPPIKVQDTRASKDATLKALLLKRGPAPSPIDNPLKRYDETMDFGKFDPEVSDYSYTVSYNATENIQLVPFINSEFAKKTVKAEIVYSNGSPKEEIAEHPSGTAIVAKNLKENDSAKIFITVTAQDERVTRTYTFNVKRGVRSLDSSISRISAYRSDDVLQTDNFMKEFDSEKTEYRITVPYKARKIQISALPNYLDARTKLESPSPVKQADNDNIPTFDENNEDLKRYPEYVVLKHPIDRFGSYKGDSATTEITVRGLSERAAWREGTEGETPFTDYKIFITRQDPASEARLADFQLQDKLNQTVKIDGSFDKDTFVYRATLPYSMDKIRFMAQTLDSGAQMEYQFVNESAAPDSSAWKELKNNVFIPSGTIDYQQAGKKYQTLLIRVTAENESTNLLYTFEIEREKPNDEAMLKSLSIADQDKGKISLSFFGDVYSYSVDVPYETTHVVFTPTAVFNDISAITVTVNNETRKVENGKESVSYLLGDYPSTTSFDIKVIPQSKDEAKAKTYTVSIKRKAPSQDALLKDLTFGDSAKMSPIFVPSKNRYKAEAAKGKRELTLTATAHHDSAIIKINGKIAESGKAFGPIEALEVKTKITVEVTAQNGKTKNTYVIDVSNPNLVNLSSNAYLEELTIRNGVMDPPFSPSVTTYNVSLKDDTSYVDMFAATEDSLAQMTMFQESREVGDDEGNLREYVGEGETTFIIEVISPDSTYTKEYNIHVFRKDEENQQTLKPISVEEINFASPGNIVVDIRKYAIVSSLVFDEMKKYPDKTITFMGNDYSLQFKGSDLGNVTIPYDTVYDFSMKFVSPEQDSIREVMDRWEENTNMVPITVYFGYHGVLPSPATFNLSLGERYKNIWLGWHHYNTERERIDYLGKIATNYRGNFSVTLTHMSTFLGSPFKIVGSENKAENDGVLYAPSRVNPATGVAR